MLSLFYLEKLILESQSLLNVIYINPRELIVLLVRTGFVFDWVRKVNLSTSSIPYEIKYFYI